MNLSKYIANLGLVIFGSVLFFVLAEVSIRIVAPDEKITNDLVPGVQSTPPEERILFYQYHPILGYEGKPNVVTEFWGHQIHQNTRGERGKEFPYLRDASSKKNKRILLLGDSGTWGYPLADSDTLWSQLEEKVKANGSLAPEIINLGTIGYTTDQELLSYVLKGTLFKPDVVVINFFSANDLWELMSNSAWGVFKPRMILDGEKLCLTDVPVVKASGWPERNLGEIFGFSERSLSFIEKSKLITFVKSREMRAGGFSLFENEKPRTPLENTEMVRYLKKFISCVKFEQLPTPVFTDYALRDAQAINLYLKIVSLLREIIHQQNAELIVTLIPSPESYSGQDQNYNNVKIGLQKLGIEPVDLDLMAHSAGLSSEQLFMIQHQNGAGNRLLAEEISKRIQSLTLSR